MDNYTIRTVESFVKLGLPVEAEAIILAEVDGDEATVAQDAAKMEKILREIFCVAVSLLNLSHRGRASRFFPFGQLCAQLQALKLSLAGVHFAELKHFLCATFIARFFGFFLQAGLGITPETIRHSLPA